MAQYRIPGIVRDQDYLFKVLVGVSNPEKRRKVGAEYLSHVQGIKHLLKERGITTAQLTLKSRAALWNMEGWAHQLLEREHFFGRVVSELSHTARQLAPHNVPHIYLKYRASDQFSHHVSYSKTRFILMPSYIDISFSEEYLQVLGTVFLHRLHRKTIPENVLHTLDHYEREFKQSRQQKPVKAEDEYLTELFQRMNRTYFEGKLPLPNLRWSQRQSLRRLGYFNYERNLLVISRCLKDSRVPEFVREGIMFHEMLHILYPARLQNGRWVYHSAEFKAHEKQFRDYFKLKKWLKTESPKIFRRCK